MPSGSPPAPTQRTLESAGPDGECIFTWTQIYDLETLPERLIVVGSGVTGAEFASAYQALGVKVTLVSSRDKVLPGQDDDAASVIQEVFENSGMTELRNVTSNIFTQRGDRHVVVTLSRRDRGWPEPTGIMAVGAMPLTSNLGRGRCMVAMKDGFVTSAFTEYPPERSSAG